MEYVDTTRFYNRRKSVFFKIQEWEKVRYWAALIGRKDPGANVGDEPVDACEQAVARHGAAADYSPVMRVDAVQTESL